MEFNNKVVVITGTSLGIGKCLKEEFSKLGCKVYGIDMLEGEFYQGDCGKKEDLEQFAKLVLEKESHIDVLINNCKPNFIGLDKCSYEDFVYSLNVGVTSCFYLTKLFKNHFAKDASIINISSSRDRQSQGNSESYTAAKGAISALTHSLAVTLKGIARVNSVSPGWIDTTNSDFDINDTHQHLVNRVGNPMDIFYACKFLASKESSFITAENIIVDGGMTKLMIYHGEKNWEYKA